MMSFSNIFIDNSGKNSHRSSIFCTPFTSFHSPECKCFCVKFCRFIAIMACVAVMWNWECFMEIFEKSLNLEEKRRAIPLHRSNLFLPTLLPTTLRKLIPLSANFTKPSNALKQFVAKLPTNCLSVFDHFVKLSLKVLRFTRKIPNL